jgi:hypothetical protein
MVNNKKHHFVMLLSVKNQSVSLGFGNHGNVWFPGLPEAFALKIMKFQGF